MDTTVFPVNLRDRIKVYRPDGGYEVCYVTGLTTVDGVRMFAYCIPERSVVDGTITPTTLNRELCIPLHATRLWKPLIPK